MDFLPILVSIVFVLVGGVIAVIADELGRKIGKRRLVLHRRIRPKYTARIVNFFTGMLITLLTIGLISIASSDVRAWLREGHRAIEERDALTQGNEQLRQQQRVLVAQTESQKRQVETQRAELQKLKAELSTSQDRYGKASSHVKELEAQQRSLDRQIRENKAAIAKAKSERVRLTHEYGALKKQRDAVVKDRDYAIKDRNEIMKRDLDLGREIAEKSKQIDEKTQEIERLQSAGDTLQREIAQKQQDKEAATKALEGAQSQLADVQDQLGRLRTMLSQYQQIASGQFNQTRTQPMIFATGEELLRAPIHANTSKEGVREQIRRAIIAAQQIAKDRGAANETGPDGIAYAGLVARDPDGRPISAETQIDVIAAKLAGSREERILRVISTFNVFQGEGAIIRIVEAPNPLVYHPGELVAEVWVDGRQDRAKILEVLDGLGPKVRARAIKDHMIPTGPDASFGSVGSEQIIDVYEQIKEANRMVRVQALAKMATRAADPLVLTLVVK